MADDKRPRNMTPEIALIAATKVAQQLVDARQVEAGDVKELARDIVKHAPGPYVDAYTLARRLEDREGWNCNFQIVSALNTFRDEVRAEIETAEKEWAARVKPQPPHSVGTRVRIGVDEIGDITEIYKYGPAKYCVKVDGDPDARPPKNARRIVNFEDVQTA